MVRCQVAATSTRSKKPCSCWKSRMLRLRGGCCSTTQAPRLVQGQAGVPLVLVPLVVGH
jgi:hypothetical protein